MVNRLFLILLAATAAPAAQDEFASVGGDITSIQDGAALPGAEVQIVTVPEGRVAARTTADERGRYLAGNLPAGLYRVVVRLDGFQDADSGEFELRAGEKRTLDMALDLRSLEESVEVIGSAEAPQATTSKLSVEGEMADISPVKGDDFSDLLPLLPGVIRGVDGRLVMNGGRPTQSSYVINNSTNVTDPSTGDLGFTLPTDAVESVDVLRNPYAAEFGRFASGITNILTRQGSNKWQFLVNNFLPRPKVRDGAIMGIGGFTPRFLVRGPLVEDKLFLAQTLQYKFLITDVPSLPDLESDTRLESFSSFTQLDANFGPNRNLTAFFSLFPRRLDFVNLDTFNPRPVTPNLHERGWNAGISDRWVLTPTAVLESTVSFKDYDVDIFGQGLDEMFLRVEENTGNYYDLQRRRTQTLQWVETLSLARSGWGGQHLFKFGIDLLNASYDGLSDSRPVNILRADGTLAQRITFGEPASQRIRNTDFALFAQDRWRVNDRLILEFGARMDRDEVFENTNFAPRFGITYSLLPGGKGIVRGGAGLFYDRVPLTAPAFPDFQKRVVERYGENGETVIGAQAFEHVLADELNTPYSFTWNLEYDHRLTPQLLVKNNFLRRQGSHELIVDPFEGDDPRLRLDTRGRSRYWEWELTTRWDYAEDSFLMASYILSKSKQDLNDFDQFFGNFRDPVIRPNEFSYADSDVRNRFLLQGTFMLPGEWIFSPVIEWRNGFPYSLIDEQRDFIGPRNDAGNLNFPDLITVDIDLQRWFTIKGIRARIGLRIFNVFNTFTPRDVQNNIDSSRFGTFFNTNERIFGGTFQIEP